MVSAYSYGVKEGLAAPEDPPEVGSGGRIGIYMLGKISEK